MAEVRATTSERQRTGGGACPPAGADDKPLNEGDETSLDNRASALCCPQGRCVGRNQFAGGWINLLPIEIGGYGFPVRHEQLYAGLGWLEITPALTTRPGPNFGSGHELIAIDSL
jgi:hypothetical protein